MSEFNANLLPFNQIRSWRYEDLIPSLLYFDKVVFPTPGLRTIDDLKSPNDLKGVPDDREVGLLTASEHRFFWPLRALIAEGVLAPYGGNALTLYFRKRLRSYERSDLEERLADPLTKATAEEFVQAATRYYDSLPDVHPSEAAEDGALDKAMAVLDWIMSNLVQDKEGWEHVALTPDGLTAVLSAFQLFDRVRRIDRLHRGGGPRALVPQSESTSYLPIRVLDTLLRRELASFSLEGDPEALSELMEVRLRRRDELCEFRTSMMDAALNLRANATDPWRTNQAIDEYVRLAGASFARVDRWMSDKWTLPRLVLRKGAAIVVAGAAAMGGILLSGPGAAAVGAAAGAALGAATAEGLKAAVGALGKSAEKSLDPANARVDVSLAYLFHAKRALQNIQ